MEINELKSITNSLFTKWCNTVNNQITTKGLKIPNKYGLGNYILINRLKGHFVIELLGFQEFSKKPVFIIEDKPCNYDLDFFINGGIQKNETENDSKGHFLFPEVNNYKNFYSFHGICLTVTKDKKIINDLFDEKMYKSSILRKDGNLPLKFHEKSSNVIIGNSIIVSKFDNQYSFRNHSFTIIIDKTLTCDQYKKLLKKYFCVSELRQGTLWGGRYLSQTVSELKSLAYHKVHETTIDKFLQLQSNYFAKALGYKSAKSNVYLRFDEKSTTFGKKFLIPDYFMERQDGFYDILDLKTGLLNNQFAFGNWSNAYFSNYATKLMGQLKGYKRYFSNENNIKVVEDDYGIKIQNPKLVGIAGNHNNYKKELVELAMESNSPDYILMNYNDLAKKMKKIIK